MFEPPPERSGNRFGVFFLCLLIMALSALGVWWWIDRQSPLPIASEPGPVPLSPPPASPASPAIQVSPAPSVPPGRNETAAVIGNDAIAGDPDLKDLMTARKARYGIGDGVDFIAAPDESIEVGGIVVPMSEIIDKIRLKRGDIIESDITGKRKRAVIEAEINTVKLRLSELEKLSRTGNGSPPPRIQAEIEKLKERLARLQRELAALDNGPGRDTPVQLYGIYVVRPNDNIWNIHFRFLRDLFDHKGIALSPVADEPTNGGQSSGVGKLLKFSENMVAIYNLKGRRLESNLDLIQPQSKVVVFNFSKVFETLDQIDYSNINHIQFDGETLWIPAVQ